MSDEFDIRKYLLSIADKDERARTIHENGWADRPEIADIVAAVADVEGEHYQQLLAALRGPE